MDGRVGGRPLAKPPASGPRSGPLLLCRPVAADERGLVGGAEGHEAAALGGAPVEGKKAVLLRTWWRMHCIASVRRDGLRDLHRQQSLPPGKPRGWTGPSLDKGTRSYL